MKQNHLAAALILGSFALLGCAPALGIVFLWTASPRSEPLFAYYLILAAPLGMLGWEIIKKHDWHRSQSKLLGAWSLINTTLLFVDLLGIFGMLIYGCVSCTVNPFPAAFSR